MKYRPVVCLVTVFFFVLVPFTSADWAMFGSDPTHSGVGTSGPISGPTQLWNYSTPNNPITTSATVVDGVVYIGLDDGPLGNWGSYVNAFNATTGAYVWRYGKVESLSTAAVANGVVYIGGNYSLFALNSTNGQPLWRFSTDWSAGTPTVANGIVYVGFSGPGGMDACRFYALSALNGAQIWNFSLNDDPEKPAAVYDGIVYLNVDGTEGRLYALDAANGKKLWSFATAYGGSPAVANGVVYTGCIDCNFYALNAKTGAKIWSVNVSSGQQWISGSSPAVYDGVVYIGGGNGVLYALNSASGQIIWNYTTQPVWNSYNYPIAGCPAVAGGVVYFGAGNGNVYAVNASNGFKLWSFTFPRFSDNGWAISSSPAVDNGVLYMSSFYGCLYAFASSDSPATQNQPTPSPTMQPSTAPTTNSTLPTTGKNSTIQVANKNGSGNVTLTLNGNITASQITQAAIITNESAAKTTINFTLTGQSGNSGFANVTVPKTAVANGTAPMVYIDDEKVQNQGFTQDADNYYVWFTTHFSTHQVSIVFAKSSQNLESPVVAVLLIVILASAAVGFIVALVRHGKPKS
jgi:eukaryotic-like serine/threonine-protein kinase